MNYRKRLIIKVLSRLTTAIATMRTKTNDPRPITVTPRAQLGMPPMSSSSIDGAEISLATTEGERYYEKAYDEKQYPYQ